MALLSTDRVDWKLDPSTWDLIVPIEWTTGVDAVVQRLTIKIRRFRDEWFADKDRGVAYLEGESVPREQAILGNKFDPTRARAEILAQIVSTANVTEVPLLEVTFDNATRKLSIAARVVVSFADTGPIETGLINIEQVI